MAANKITIRAKVAQDALAADRHNIAPVSGSSGSDNQVELQWSNKELRLLSTESGEVWVRDDDFRLAEVRLLTPTLATGNTPPNLLICGDALHALKSLARLEQYRRHFSNSIKLCYIDPPFNTGEDFAHYPDSHQTPAWLSLLREHLIRIKDLLAPDGSVWVHLDDSEQHRARCVLDEIFGVDAFVATIIWQKRTSRDNRKAFSAMHDYIHVYAPIGAVAWKKRRNALPDEGAFTNIDGDPRGPWRSVPMTAQAGHATSGQFYTVVSPTGATHDPPKGRCWTYTKQRLEELIADDRVYWPRAGQGKPRLKHFQSESNGLAPFTVWTAAEVGENATAKKALMSQFPEISTFDTPKPLSLLERIVHIATDPGEVVLDCFLGSGTTAVAAQQMGRRWIGIERNVDTLERFALPRLDAITEGRRIKGKRIVNNEFAVLDVAPSIFVVDSSQCVILADWATGEALAEAIAAQLGYLVDRNGPFIGKSGRTRLAVIEGLADDQVVGKLAAALGPRQLLDLMATNVDPSALNAVTALGRGHRVRRIPEGILEAYEMRTGIFEFRGVLEGNANMDRVARVSGSR
jgi:adenine-specific DNA-methyltransferase